MAVCVATHTPSALPDKDSGLDRPISESPGSYFPQVSINVAKALSQRRIRSFGDLQLLAGSDNSTKCAPFHRPRILPTRRCRLSCRAMVEVHQGARVDLTPRVLQLEQLVQ